MVSQRCVSSFKLTSETQVFPRFSPLQPCQELYHCGGTFIIGIILVRASMDSVVKELVCLAGVF